MLVIKLSPFCTQPLVTKLFPFRMQPLVTKLSSPHRLCISPQTTLFLSASPPHLSAADPFPLPIVSALQAAFPPSHLLSFLSTTSTTYTAHLPLCISNLCSKQGRATLAAVRGRRLPCAAARPLAAASRYDVVVGSPLALWRGTPIAPRAVVRTPTAASRSGPEVASLDHEDTSHGGNDLHPLAIAMDVRDQMPPTEMAFERSGIK
ncbi:hypothetical protein ZIOFF_052155 [Zingiber officinale]|uniref:Uncharacterized protein n=1 Tax=Zingiber officinale TaxID=94328 RepID=A0A8J5FLH1_ZINOF|nr:hypothetical protein ZIOFF_052155 [Zingiber officinale]